MAGARLKFEAIVLHYWHLRFDDTVHLCEAVLTFQSVVDVSVMTGAPVLQSVVNVLHHCMTNRSNLMLSIIHELVFQGFDIIYM